MRLCPFFLPSQRTLHGSGVFRGPGIYECEQFYIDTNKSPDLANLKHVLSDIGLNLLDCAVRPQRMF